jgi:hypothetical protein
MIAIHSSQPQFHLSTPSHEIISIKSSWLQNGSKTGNEKIPRIWFFDFYKTRQFSHYFNLEK